jgi:elongation factor 1-alpha
MEPSLTLGVDKPRLALVAFGYRQSGKSTMFGHMMYKKGMVDKRTIEKFEIESNYIGKGSYNYPGVI